MYLGALVHEGTLGQGGGSREVPAVPASGRLLLSTV